MEAKDILNDIISDFEVSKFTGFFREKNRSFAPRQEELEPQKELKQNFFNTLNEVKRKEEISFRPRR